jgi:hypothetical protein
MRKDGRGSVQGIAMGEWTPYQLDIHCELRKAALRNEMQECNKEGSNKGIH